MLKTVDHVKVANFIKLNIVGEIKSSFLFIGSYEVFFVSNFQYTYGLGHVPSYQTSARPFLTASLTVPTSGSEPLEISFDSVSRFVVITNTLPGTEPNVPLRFGFSVNGINGAVNNNYGILNNSESFEAEFKVIKIYLLSDSSSFECSASVIAGLTGISETHLATNWSGSVGVG